MKKGFALLIALLLTLIVAGNWLFFNASSLFPDKEIVVIARVIDGDTIEFEDGRTVRLLNINTPEKNEFGASLAYNYLLNFENESVGFEYEGIEKYGRILGRIYSVDGKYLNLELVELGFAHPFLVEDREIENFKGAEKEAREGELGIWQKSRYYGCLEVEVYEKEEYLLIEDSCNLEFEGWTLKDESTKKYIFPKFSSNSFTLSSESGENEANKLYWGRGDIWNNDRDSVFIRDREGLLVFFNSYGY